MIFQGEIQAFRVSGEENCLQAFTVAWKGLQGWSLPKFTPTLTPGLIV